jgi:hypothetical protein
MSALLIGFVSACEWSIIMPTLLGWNISECAGSDIVLSLSVRLVLIGERFVRLHSLLTGYDLISAWRDRLHGLLARHIPIQLISIIVCGMCPGHIR